MLLLFVTEYFYMAVLIFLQIYFSSKSKTFWSFPPSTDLQGAAEEPCSAPGLSLQLVPVRETSSDHLLANGPLEAGGSALLPNLLDIFQGKERGGLVSLGAVATPSDRLALIGGAKGVLEKMADDGLCPDVRTLTLLADATEPSVQSLQSLLQAAKLHKVKLDAGFFNSVIRRAARAGDKDSVEVNLPYHAI